MSITSYSQVRSGSVTTITVVSSLTGLVYYHWYVDGLYVATTTRPVYSLTLDDGEQVRIDAVDTNDPTFDPVLNAPQGYPARVSLWWTRSESLDAVMYRIFQQGPIGEYLADIYAPPGQWSFSWITPRLVDRQIYIWDVYPIDAAGNVGASVSLILFASVLRVPDAPRFSATYSAGTQKVTIAAA